MYLRGYGSKITKECSIYRPKELLSVVEWLNYAFDVTSKVVDSILSQWVIFSGYTCFLIGKLTRWAR